MQGWDVVSVIQPAAPWSSSLQREKNSSNKDGKSCDTSPQRGVSSGDCSTPTSSQGLTSRSFIAIAAAIERVTAFTCATLNAEPNRTI